MTTATVPESEQERLDRLRAAFAALTPTPPAPAVRWGRVRAQKALDTDGLPRGLHNPLR